MAKDFLNYVLVLRDPSSSSPEPDPPGECTPPPGRIIGVLGAFRFPEVGYMLNRSYWGAGFATEALQAFIRLFWAEIPPGPFTAAPPDAQAADSRVPLGDAEESDVDAVTEEPSGGGRPKVTTNFMEAYVDPENVGSARVLVKCGFELWRTGRQDFESAFLGVRDTAVYRLARPGTELGVPPGREGEVQDVASGFA